MMVKLLLLANLVKHKHMLGLAKVSKLKGLSIIVIGNSFIISKDMRITIKIILFLR